MTTPEDWVLIEAARQANVGDETVEYLRRAYHHGTSFRALCDMIQKYEKPPLDRKLACAQEAAAQLGEPISYTAVRAIELWEEGFGK